MRSAKALVVLAAGFALGVLPALGASHQVKDLGNTWSPSSLTIAVGDDVDWSWTGFHNVAFEDGARSGVPTSGGSYERTFNAAGTFKYICEFHGSSMAGTITVNQSSTGTTDTTGTTPTETTPTNTSPTQTTTAPADTAAPVITSLRRRSSRRTLILTFRSNEAGKVRATIRRRKPGSRVFRFEVRITSDMLQGGNRITYARSERGLRRGAYRVAMVFVDGSGNATKRTLIFKIA